jgi:TolA-binding protein
MNSRSEQLFGINGTVSEQEMRDYHAGTLSPSEMNRIERIASSNPMVAAALEGSKLIVHPEALSEVRQAVNKRAGNHYGLGLKLSLVVALAATIGYIGWQQQQHEAVPMVAENNESGLFDEQPNKEVGAKEAIASHELVDHHSTDSSVSITISKPIQKAEEPISSEKFVTYVNVPEPIINDNPVQVDGQKPAKKPTVKIPSSHRVYHVENYKVVDYRGKREKPFSLLDRNLTGVSAQYDSANDANSSMEEPVTKEVPYVDYLQDAMVNFSLTDYRAAEKQFQTVLKTYEDDANALFYGGLSLYRLGKYKKARAYFEASVKLPIPTFHQESAFYLAQCYYREKNSSEAVALFSAIAEEGGFYAVQAQEMVLKLTAKK